MGHEFLGAVHDVGSAVATVKPGDLVLAPLSWSDGSCEFCVEGLQTSSSSTTASALAAFATFGAGFLARPLGGALLGHFEDRIGRKAMLVLSLFLTGAATVAIGVPAYAQLGVWAPLLLVACRLLQGLGLGGEWGGAVLLAVEHAPPDKRGFYGGFPQLGAPIG